MKNKLLVQDNALTIARYEMTSLEKNIMYAIMSQIEDIDSPMRTYKISVTDISEFTKRRVRHDDFKDAIQRLLTRDFSIKDSGGYLQSTFIASAYYDDRGFVEIEISIKIRPYLFALKKNFTSFGLETATSLNSKYSKRLYEMLCQFRSTGILRVTTHELKERFCLLNEDGTEKFEKWSSFEDKVLSMAQAEINEKAEFQFDYHLKKEGRKITAIEFAFRKTEGAPKVEPIVPQRVVSDVVALNARMLERFTNYGLTTDQVAKIIAKHTEKVINKQLYELDCNKETVKNTAAYLLKIFEI
jgi:plasmid replication initiation protein